MVATRVKICGITNTVDAQAAIAAGADAIGLVFYSNSPRAVTVQQAAEIAAAVGPFATLVGLFVNAGAEYVREVLAQVPLHVLQFHGDENQSFCQQFGRPWYKAIRMNPELEPVVEMEKFPCASGYLFDAWSKDQYGGTGKTFDWQRVPQSDRAIILAGGLTPENVGQAVMAVKPYAVDVSGGVERAPGQKSAEKIQQFINNAKAHNEY